MKNPSRYVGHSDDWPWQPGGAVDAYRGWYVHDDTGQAIIGPFEHRSDALDIIGQAPPGHETYYVPSVADNRQAFIAGAIVLLLIFIAIGVAS